MKKTVEYKISKDEVIRRINSLIDGEIKMTDVNWGIFGHFYGSVSEDKFTFGSMTSFDLRIDGSFRENEKIIDLNIDYHDMKALMLMMLNGITFPAIVLSLFCKVYSCAITMGIIMLIGNIFLAWIIYYSANEMYDKFCKLIEPKDGVVVFV